MIKTGQSAGQPLILKLVCYKGRPQGGRGHMGPCPSHAKYAGALEARDYRDNGRSGPSPVLGGQNRHRFQALDIGFWLQGA